MSRRVPIVTLVLAAFAATTAVPGPSVVAHRHAGGDHHHVHAILAHDDDHDHHDHELHDHGHAHGVHQHDHHHHRPAAQARRHRGHTHRPRLAADTHDPLHHTHVIAPFQPATRSDTPTVASVTLVTAEPASAPAELPAPGPRRVRSRGPPSAARF